MKYVIVGYGRMGRAIGGQAENRGHVMVSVVDPAAIEQGARAAIEPQALSRHCSSLSRRVDASSCLCPKRW